MRVKSWIHRGFIFGSLTSAWKAQLESVPLFFRSEKKMKLKFMLVASGLLVCAGGSHAQERKIKRADLPPAVEKTVAAESAGATIKGLSTEKEKGETYYEVEMTVNGHSKDVLINTSGAVVEVEEEVAMDKLPGEVKAGLEAKAGAGKILKVESLMKKGKLVAYEAQIVSKGKKSEVQVGPDGKPLDQEE
jgi:uncharacterized membrane protein YkoI